MNARPRLVALLCSMPLACASTPPPPPTTAATVALAPTPRNASAAAPTEGEIAALDAIVTQLLADGAPARDAAESLGIPLALSRGARTLTGEAAPDDRVRESSVALRAASSAVVLATTACGNVWLVGMHLDEGRWSVVERTAVVGDAQPGACRLTHATAASRAMITREARELIVTYASESEDGVDARDPTLRVFHVTEGGALETLSGEIALGGSDDATGAVREGEWVVDEALLLPRDLYIQVQPGRRGPGGSAPPFIVRRTYRLQGRRLVLVDESSSRVRRPAPTNPALE